MTKQDYCKRVNSLISETMTECAGIQLTYANMDAIKSEAHKWVREMKRKSKKTNHNDK